MTEITPALSPDSDEDMTRAATELEAENPLWIVVFGVYTRQFVAFPRFDVPDRAIAVAYYPAALASRMREIEQRVKRYRKSMPRAAIASLAGAHKHACARRAACPRTVHARRLDGCIHSPERKPWL